MQSMETFTPGPVIDEPVFRTVKPMLAKDPKDIDKLSYPLLAQPKLDGIRAMVVDGKLVSRTLKPIPNLQIRAALERPEFEGFDGELIVGDGTDFQASTSFVMSPNKTGANWSYNVFDLWNLKGVSNIERQNVLSKRLTDLAWTDSAVFGVTTKLVNDKAELDEFEAACLAIGLEGVIARVPDAPYKFGRSSPLKGPLFKIKRFIDFEAEVIGVYEKMHNDNPAMTNLLGRTERSTAQAGKRGAGVLGGLELRAINGPHKGQEFRCGTGFDDLQRMRLWLIRSQLENMTAKIKSFPSGVKELPRFPVFLGWRDMEIDG